MTKLLPLRSSGCARDEGGAASDTDCRAHRAPISGEQVRRLAVRLSRHSLLLMLWVATAPATSHGLSEQAKPWRGALTAGPHPVGFRSEVFSRKTVDGRSRRLTLSMWFPAVSGTGEPAQVGDFFEIIQQEEQLTETDGLTTRRGFVAAITGDPEALSEETAEAGLAIHTFSRLGAEPDAPRTSPYPLAIWSSRHATILAQAPMSEILASHGTVVASVWSSDPPLAFIWEDHPESLKLETIDVQTDDLEFALARVRANEYIDPERGVVLAWSYGGQTAARLQERDPTILGVLGLDANVVPARPEERLRLRAPLIWLLGGSSEGRGLESASDLTAPNVVIALPELAHGNFNALEGFLPSLLGAETVYAWSKSGPIAVEGYRVLVEIAVESVDTMLHPEAPLERVWEKASTAAGDLSVRLVHDGSTR